jgi:transcriptional regulator with XRE-family HTH domain
MSSAPQTITGIVRLARMGSGISRRQLARALGVDHSAIRELENGRTPTAIELGAIKRALELEMAWAEHLGGPKSKGRPEVKR